MINDFFTNNVNFVISYVHLKRNDDICKVKAKITPEHKIHKKAYNVIAIINEKEEQVISSASQGKNITLSHLFLQILQIIICSEFNIFLFVFRRL